MPVIPAGAPWVTVQRACSYCNIERLGSSANAWKLRLMPIATSRARAAFLSSVTLDPALAKPASFNVAVELAVGCCHGHSVQRAAQSPTAETGISADFASRQLRIQLCHRNALFSLYSGMKEASSNCGTRQQPATVHQPNTGGSDVPGANPPIQLQIGGSVTSPAPLASMRERDQAPAELSAKPGSVRLWT